MIDKKIHDLVEVKLSDENISPALIHFTNLLKPLSPTQVVRNLSRELEKHKIPIQKAENFLVNLE
jgi:hypothetical protein